MEQSEIDTHSIVACMVDAHSINDQQFQLMG